MQTVAAFCLSILGAKRCDVSVLREKTLSGLGATILPDMPPALSTIAMSEIAERVDEIFSAIEGMMVDVHRQSQACQDQ
jgi:hypothetical protein